MVGDTKFNFRVACILENNNRVLLHKADIDNFWNMSGGRIKAGENSLCAIKREMEEELNVKLKNPKLIHIKLEIKFEY